MNVLRQLNGGRKPVNSILLSVYILLAASSVCNALNDTSPSLSKLRYSSHRGRGHDSSNREDLYSSLRKRGGRGGRGARGARPGSAAAASSSDGENGSACFPESSLVRVQGRGMMQISELRIGDMVETTDGYSAVYMFSHREQGGMFKFVKVSTDFRDLVVSKGHYIYKKDGNLETAGAIKIGDLLEREDGGTARVVKKEMVEAVGLYNPHTLHGEMVVNGIRVSVYTESVDPKVAKSLLAPMRAAFGVLGIDVTGGVFEAERLLHICRSVAHFLKSLRKG